jgi:DHA1 family bicyclomycin/chloramphenicol resistance-like MFS transporter
VRVESMTIGRGRAASLVILGALTTFGPMAIDLYLPAFPDVAEDLGVSVVTVPLTLTAAMLGLGLGQVFYGPLSDRFGRKKPLLAGLLLFTVASLACAWAPSFEVLLGMRFLQSLGGSAGVVIGRAIVRDLYRGRELARALSIVVMVFALAPVMAPTLGALLLQLGSWRWLFVFLAAFGLACIAASFLLPETLEVDRRTDHGVAKAARVYGSLIRDPRYLAPAVLAGSTYVVLFAYISTSPAVMLDFFGMSELGFAVLFGFLSLCYALGAQLNSRLLKSFDVIPLIVVFVAIQAIAAVVLLIDAIAAPTLLVVSISIGVAMGTIGVTSANSTALCLDPFPRAAGSAAALLGLIGMTVGAIVSSSLVAIHLPVVTELGTVMLFGAGIGLATLPFLLRRRTSSAGSTYAEPASAHSVE